MRTTEVGPDEEEEGREEEMESGSKGGRVLFHVY